jgi:prepilin-type processing-associated H-X9-DG protein
MFLFVEEHPYYHISRNLEGNFNVTDRIVARHGLLSRGSTGKGRTNIAYLDGHVDSPLYDLSTSATSMFDKIGFPSSETDVNKTFLWEFVPDIKPPF